MFYLIFIFTIISLIIFYRFEFSGKEIAGPGTFVEINNTVSVSGLCGIDRLNAFFVSERLADLIKLYELQLSKRNTTMGQLIRTALADLRPYGKLVGNHTRKYYAATTTKGKKLWDKLSVIVHDIGQAQLIRQKIANELRFRCQLDSNLLHCAIDTLNEALLVNLRRHYHDPRKPAPKKGSALLSDFSDVSFAL